MQLSIHRLCRTSRITYFKGGEKMNVATNLALIGGVSQTSSNRFPQGNMAGESSFGSVFTSVKMNRNVAAEATTSLGSMVTAIQDIFGAESIEEIQEALVFSMNGEENQIFLSATSTLQDFEQLIGVSHEDFMKSITSILEESGANVVDTEYINDFWSLLNAIEEAGPQFFNTLVASLQGDGKVEPNQAADVLAFLKLAMLEVPKMDLLMKQEQQIFSLQSFMAAASEQFESKLNAASTRLGTMPVLEAQHPVQFTVHVDAENGDTKQNAKDSSTFNNSVGGTVPTAKPEVSFTEMENRANSRNEVLMKEMQQIFKRSNFGQTGGTNRLLIKLYPEHLGQVRIELLQTNGIMTARILASTALGKEMLDSQLHQLRAAFLQQNLQVDRIDISQTLQDAARHDREQAFNQQFRREQEGSEEQQEQSKEEEMTFQEYMIELEV